jgi:DNA polymerase delta subunit 1
MPAAVLKPQKRILGDATKAHRNGNVPSPSAAKKRKLDPQSSPATRFKSSQNGVDRKIGSSQPKSQFEEEVLEKLTQDISGLKQKNSEKDQQWERPSLDDFDEGRESLCFQQIEAEEGSLHGGKTTVKLFGVTEVTSCDALRTKQAALKVPDLVDRPLCTPSCHRLSPLSLRRRPSLFPQNRLRRLQGLP